MSILATSDFFLRPKQNYQIKTQHTPYCDDVFSRNVGDPFAKCVWGGGLKSSYHIQFEPNLKGQTPNPSCMTQVVAITVKFESVVNLAAQELQVGHTLSEHVKVEKKVCPKSSQNQSRLRYFGCLIVNLVNPNIKTSCCLFG